MFKTIVDSEHLAQVQKLDNEYLAKEEQLLADHQTKQVEMLTAHKKQMRKILSRSRGIWISDFRTKKLGIVVLAYTLICFLYAKFGS